MSTRPGTLILVGTPIGNMGDLSDRARATLGAVGVVAAEDTRRTGRLLAGLGITVRLLSFFDGNESERVPQLVRMLREGMDVAVVSDAGMPGLSDPGYRLVAACIEAGIRVDVVPGPSAAVTALVISGLPTDRFVFEGFLPRGASARAARLAELAGERRTIVAFESPRRTAATLREALRALGDRRVAVARELTKLHQEILRGRISEVLPEVEGRELKGEVVLVVEGVPAEAERGLDEAVDVAARLMDEGRKKREAARSASRLTGVPTGEIYDALVRRSGG